MTSFGAMALRLVEQEREAIEQGKRLNAERENLNVKDYYSFYWSTREHNLGEIVKAIEAYHDSIPFHFVIEK